VDSPCDASLLERELSGDGCLLAKGRRWVRVINLFQKERQGKTYPMSYLALARRYRPDDFSKILAQNHITKTLSNAVKSGRIAHAFLLCGPRGTGKTTTARVLAKSLNCEKGPTDTPCGECVNCKEIKAGISADVFEIDAASNRGIDDIRELRENVRYAPVSSRYKVYIIDEVHRLTQEAFDALLKTLEEPPPHVIFIFATTEPQNLPATILSRTQRFDFKRVPVSALAETVNNIAKQEKQEIEPKAALMIARKADGSLRDALSLLDQLTSFSESKITAESASEILGLVKADFLFKITSSIIEHNASQVLELLNIYIAEGGDIDEMSTELSYFLSKLLMIKNKIRDIALLEIDTVELEKYEALTTDIDTFDLLRMLQILADFIAAKKSGVDPVVAIEVALTRMAGLDKTIEINQLLVQGISAKPASQSTSKKMNYSQPPVKHASRYSKPDNTNNQPATTKIQPSGPHKLEDINKWWPNFLNFIKAKRKMVWVNLQHMSIEKAENNMVTLGYTDKNGGNKSLLETDKSFIAEQISEYCGSNVGIVFIKANNNIDNGQKLPQGNVNKILEQNPKIKTIIDNIDGDIIGS